MSNAKLEILLSAKDVSTKAISSFESRITRATGAVVSLKGAIAGLAVGYGLAELGRSFTKAAIDAERFQKALDAATGSVALGAKENQFLIEESERLGLVYQDQIKMYAQIAANAKSMNFSLAQQREVFTAIAEAGTALQLSTYDMEGAMRAVVQTMSKGKVQAEELRGQLAERIPSAFQIAAKSMGYTTEELSDALELGAVYADEFIPRFSKALRQEFAGSIEAAAHTFQANLNRMQSNWFQFRKEMMNSGPFVAMKQGLEEFVTYLASAEGKMNLSEWAQISAVAVVDAFAAMTIGANIFYEILQDSKSLLAGLISGTNKLRLDFLNKKIGALEKSMSPEYSQNRPLWKQQELHERAEVLKGERAELKASIGMWDDYGTAAQESLRAANNRFETLKKSLSDIRGGARSNVAKISTAGVSGATGAGQAETIELRKFKAMLGKVESDISKSIDKRIQLEQAGAEAVYKSWQEQYHNLSEMDQQFRLDKIESALDSFFEDLEPMAEETASVWEDAFDGWASGFSSTLNDMLWQSDVTFKEIARSFSMMITQTMIQQRIVDPMTTFMGGFFHTGGIVGSGEGQTAALPAGLFAGAPRFHSGLMPDEFPAVLQKGEGVFTPAQMKALGSAPNVQVTVVNNTGAEADVTQTPPRWDGDRWVMGVVLDAMQRNKSGFATNMRTMIAR